MLYDWIDMDTKTLDKNPFISVLTPTWNRAAYLSRVWGGLDKQTFTDFEWIVANDGSDDNTIEIIKGLAAKSDFPVTLINASCRIGKSRMDNELAKAASGQFIIWCDSDDVLLPNALSELQKTWNSIPKEERSEFCGVSALCDTEEGVLGNDFYQSGKTIDLSWNELFHRLNSDLVIFTRAELVKANPFLEVDFLIPESSVWSKIGTRKSRFIPSVLERKYYKSANCLSHSGHMSYNRGNAYAMALEKENAAQFVEKATQLRRAINYLRYCRHGEIPFGQAMSLWHASLIDRVLFVFLLPLASLLAVRDSLQGKVKKTHREFNNADTIVKIEVERLNF